MLRPSGRDGDGVTYQFDAFTLDVGTRRLMRDHEEVHLSPKAFDLLLLLVENRSQAMAKGELHRRLWPSTYVTETNLAGLIVELRRALADSADQPQYIRTMHRFGYWFVGQVQEEPAAAAIRPTPRYWLVWETRQIPLTDGDNVVGRARNAEVWVDAPGVSRQHARFRLTEGVVTVEDLGSKNGTYLRGKRVTAPSRVADGDQIRIGSVVITFRIPPPPESTETVRA
jgi:DNA-binding winged helix-turn-helix (wHTH) protein